MRMLRPMAFLLAAALGACQPDNYVPPSDTTPRPGQAAALAVVWTKAYGRTDAPPIVHFVTELDAECGGTAWVDPWWQACAGGVTMGRDVWIAWPQGQSWGGSHLAHEAMHAIVADPLHRLSVWQSGGQVEQAGAELARADDAGELATTAD